MMIPPAVSATPIKYEDTARVQTDPTAPWPNSLAYELQADSSAWPRVRTHTPTKVVIRPRTKTDFLITSQA